ncbi:Uncharacterised protein [uncultured archaeon]|nr:Uncharacterised protein [uncultured archaeon]
MYEIIRTFSPIFRGLKFENSRAASIYYVNLIINFPTNFQGILNEAQAIYGNEVNRQALQSGRRELLRYGIIGRTYFTEDADVDFDRETYLPVNPEIIWDENKDQVKTYWTQPEEMAFRKTKVKELYGYYLRNFKKYGLGIEKGSITGLFNVYWMWRGGINIFNYNYTKKIDIMVNNIESLIVPDYWDYIEKALKRGMTQRVLYDLNTKRKILKDEEAEIREYEPVIEQRLNRYMKLYEDYRDQIEIRYTPVPYTTTRQTIYYNEEGPYLASDYRRLLSLDPKEPPYYISTVYLQGDLIDHIKENFESAWANSIVWMNRD